VRAFSAALPEAPAWSAAIAQLVEHVIRNDGVTGSNPVCGTNDLAAFSTISKCRQGNIWGNNGIMAFSSSKEAVPSRFCAPLQPQLAVQAIAPESGGHR
jgi:hypothetical protein